MDILELDKTIISDQKAWERANKRYEALKKAGVCFPGVSPYIELLKPPAWFDQEKFKASQKLSNRYFVSLFLAHFSGLMLLFQMPTIYPPVMETDSHSTVAKLFVRYLETFIHLKDWYAYDPYDKNSKAYKSLRNVTLMHKQIGRKMNSKGELEPFKGPIWVSQFDMVLTQWSIVAPFLLFPKKCGMHQVTVEEMESLLYFWQVTGYNLGIDDEFNCCTGGLHESFYFCKLLLDRDYRPHLLNLPYPCNLGFEAAKGLSIAVQPLAPIVSCQGLMRRWYKLLEIPHYIPVEDKFGYKSIVHLLDTLLQKRFWHWCFGIVLKIALYLQSWRRNAIRDKLEAEHSDKTFVPTCPFDYKNPTEFLSI